MRSLNDQFGWYLSLKQLADSGIFTKDGMSAMQSAERANLYEGMQYLAAAKAESKFYVAYQNVKE